MNIFKHVQALAESRAEVLRPFAIDMDSFFEWRLAVDAVKRRDKGLPAYYERKPPIALTIYTDSQTRVAIRPCWKKREVEDRDWVDDEQDAPGYSGIYSSPSVHDEVTPVKGKLSVEMIAPGRKFSLTLDADSFPFALRITSGKAELWRTRRGVEVDNPADIEENARRLDVILGVATKLVKDPWETIVESGKISERCCNCHKLLTDVKSLSRGIGPECIQGFITHEVPGFAAKIVTKYRSIDE